MNDKDTKLDNRKERLMLVVAALFASTPQGMRITGPDIDAVIDNAFDIERRVMKKLEASA